MSAYNTPDLSRLGFARTNRQTIAQRAALIRALLPETRSIAEVCCGDCTAQWAIYGEMPHMISNTIQGVRLTVVHSALAADGCSLVDVSPRPVAAAGRRALGYGAAGRAGRSARRHGEAQ